MMLVRTLLVCGSLALFAGAARAADDAGLVEDTAADGAAEATDGAEDDDAGEEAPIGIQPTTTPDNVGCAASPVGHSAAEGSAMGLFASALAFGGLALGRRLRRSS